MRNLAALLLVVSVPLWAAENLEKKADLAIDRAERAVKELHKAYDDGKLAAALETLAGSVEEAGQAMKDSGKNGRKSPKHFKRSELRTREIIRRLENVSRDVDVDDREPVEKARARVQKVHDYLLSEIMGIK